MLTVNSRSIQAKLLYGAFFGGLTFITISASCADVLASKPKTSNSAFNLGGVVKLDCDTKTRYLQTKDCSVGGDLGLQLTNEPIRRVKIKKQPCRVQAGAANNSFSDEYAYCVEIR